MGVLQTIATAAVDGIVEPRGPAAASPALPFPETPGDAGRAALLARWRHLTRVVLPGMAAAQGWPISLDHCFMRACLDAAVGARWDRVVRRPAMRHLTGAQLAAAVAVAEAVVAEPGRLSALKAASLRMRRGG